MRRKLRGKPRFAQSLHNFTKLLRDMENAAAPSRGATILQKTAQNFTVSDWSERYHPIQTGRKSFRSLRVLFMRSSCLRAAFAKGSLRPECVLRFFLFCAAALQPNLLRAQAVQPVAPVVSERAIHGIVKSGNMPIPGAGVSAFNAATKE